MSRGNTPPGKDNNEDNAAGSGGIKHKEGAQSEIKHKGRKGQRRAHRNEYHYRAIDRAGWEAAGVHGERGGVERSAGRNQYVGKNGAVAQPIVDGEKWCAKAVRWRQEVADGDRKWRTGGGNGAKAALWAGGWWTAAGSSGSGGGNDALKRRSGRGKSANRSAAEGSGRRREAADRPALALWVGQKRQPERDATPWTVYAASTCCDRHQRAARSGGGIGGTKRDSKQAMGFKSGSRRHQYNLKGQPWPCKPDRAAGSRAAGQQGSRAAGQQGSRAAGQQGSRGAAAVEEARRRFSGWQFHRRGPVPWPGNMDQRDPSAISGRVGEHRHAPAGGGEQRAGPQAQEITQKIFRVDDRPIL
ncbi:hypothetical protein B0H19DRAFT_1082530 [Mycena capillaripes]|nr:hypothetical protein B0H19DRAFT_1082530 [Mycena capillaripes]